MPVVSVLFLFDWLARERRTLDGMGGEVGRLWGFFGLGSPRLLIVGAFFVMIGAEIKTGTKQEEDCDATYTTL